jgi:hypothetical protein
MKELRYNTATRITVGPFYDVTDAVTPEVAITVTSEKLTMIVDTGGVPTLVLDTAPTASAGDNDMVHITGDDSGYYDLELTAANVNYYGRVSLSLTNSAVHLPVFHEFEIVSGQYYDAKYGTANFSANIDTDTIAEMAQGAPPASPTLKEAVNYLYRKLRNKNEATATEGRVYDDAGTTILFKETHSDDGTMFTKGEYLTGA